MTTNMLDWFLTDSQGNPVNRRVVLRRIVVAEVFPNGACRLHLNYPSGGSEEVFDGRTKEEAAHKLQVYLDHEDGCVVHSSRVDTLDEICSQMPRR